MSALTQAPQSESMQLLVGSDGQCCIPGLPDVKALARKSSTPGLVTISLTQAPRSESILVGVVAAGQWQWTMMGWYDGNGPWGTTA